MSTLSSNFTPFSIYIVLKLRSVAPPFHWGIYIPTAPTSATSTSSNAPGRLWHAANRTGDWNLEAEETTGLPFDMAFCTALRVGDVSTADRGAAAVDDMWTACQRTLDAVPADGVPSPNTGEKFSCRVWVQDALLALETEGIVNIGGMENFERIERRLVELGEGNREAVETGVGPAQIWN